MQADEASIHGTFGMIFMAQSYNVM
jgi:N-terminal acetyltransferase B complex non-catalytic subunit